MSNYIKKKKEELLKEALKQYLEFCSGEADAKVKKEMCKALLRYTEMLGKDLQRLSRMKYQDAALMAVIMTTRFNIINSMK